nr:MAG TPA: hypothetical protein [Caudoviricetes sp.]
MKKGQIVTATKVSIGSDSYLTEGKSYEIVSGIGDECQYGKIKTEFGFEIVNDMGTKSFCLYPECLHAKWSISE